MNSFYQIKDQALQLARSLKSHDIKKGDVVAIILPNCLEYPVLIQEKVVTNDSRELSEGFKVF